MDNPDDERTIINVKSVSVREWDRGKAAANRSGETMGEWLTKAIRSQANLEAGERYIPPGKPANPAPVPANPAQAVDLREVAAVLMAMKETGLRVQKRVESAINDTLHTKLKGDRPKTPKAQLDGKMIELTPDNPDPKTVKPGRAQKEPPADSHELTSDNPDPKTVKLEGDQPEPPVNGEMIELTQGNPDPKTVKPEDAQPELSADDGLIELTQANPDPKMVKPEGDQSLN